MVFFVRCVFVSFLFNQNKQCFQNVLYSNFCLFVFSLDKEEICPIKVPFLFSGTLINLFSSFRD